MTPLQVVETRLGEVRIRLSTIAGADLTEETRGELETLRTEYADLERRAAALRLVGDDSPKTPATLETSEGREYAGLVSRSRVGGVFEAVCGGNPVTGATAELQQHYGMPQNKIPLELLARNWTEKLETRAVTPAPTDVGQMQQSIIPYVFPDAAASFIGIDMPTVGVGEAVFPVLTSTLSVGTPAENADQADTTGAFSADVLSPARLQAAYFFSREDRARFAGMEESLRDNLSMGLSDALDKEVIAGTNGLLNGTVLANHNVTATTTFDLYLSGLVYGRVDGRYASTSGDIKLLVGSHAYGHAGRVFRATESDNPVLDRLMSITGGVRVSAHVPAASSNRQNVLIRRGMNRDMVAPIWQGVEIIYDPITKAAGGQILITAVMLHAVKLLRGDGFYKQQIQSA